MTLSQIELNRRKFHVATHYVNTLLADAIDFVQPLADKKSILLSMEPAAKEAEVFCDAEAVHQILSNLLDNALKYTPDGGNVVLAARLTGDDFVEIQVRDTGIGVPPEELPRLFERFYRVDKARSREMGGTGLGLAIVKHLVRAQGGDIRVDSRVNHGSTFSFTLPARESISLRGAKVQQELTVS
jgi:two-component system phosphate regulon sensor histidine kinase PhoR